MLADRKLERSSAWPVMIESFAASRCSYIRNVESVRIRNGWSHQLVAPPAVEVNRNDARWRRYPVGLLPVGCCEGYSPSPSSCRQTVPSGRYPVAHAHLRVPGQENQPSLFPSYTIGCIRFVCKYANLFAVAGFVFAQVYVLVRLPLHERESKEGRLPRSPVRDILGCGDWKFYD